MKAVAQVLLTRVEEVMKVSRSLAESGNNQDLEMIDSMISTGSHGQVMVVIFVEKDRK